MIVRHKLSEKKLVDNQSCTELASLKGKLFAINFECSKLSYCMKVQCMLLHVKILKTGKVPRDNFVFILT